MAPPTPGGRRYAPLSIQAPGNGQDYWILSLHLVTVSTVAGASTFIVTIHNMRTRGMSWTRMPLFVWSIELYSWLIMAVMPVLAAALTLLLLDRGISIGGWDVQTDFFNPDAGGSALLYQHAFWFFGHPEVYVIVLPAFGIISEVLPVFARKPIFGYKAIVASTVAIALLLDARLGAPHVHGGPSDPAPGLVHDRVDGDRRPDGHQDLQLVGHAVARETSRSRHPCSSRSASSRSSSSAV